MSKSKSWSVKGVDPEARRLAREAAQGAGLSIGAWIDRAIMQQARVETEPAPGADNVGTTAVTTGAQRPPSPSLATAATADTETAVKDAVEDAVAKRSVAWEPGTSSLLADPGARPALPSAGEDEPPKSRRVRFAFFTALVVVVVAVAAWAYLELLPQRGGELGMATREPSPPGAEGEAASAVTGDRSEPVGGDAGSQTAEPGIVEMLRVAAEGGDAGVQHELATLYATGRDVARDDAEALKWFERAAVQGLSNAQFNLGVMYAEGRGVRSAPARAGAWDRRAAEHGHPNAHHKHSPPMAEGRQACDSRERRRRACALRGPQPGRAGP